MMKKRSITLVCALFLGFNLSATSAKWWQEIKLGGNFSLQHGPIAGDGNKLVGVAVPANQVGGGTMLREFSLVRLECPGGRCAVVPMGINLGQGRGDNFNGEIALGGEAIFVQEKRAQSPEMQQFWERFNPLLRQELKKELDGLLEAGTLSNDEYARATRTLFGQRTEVGGLERQGVQKVWDLVRSELRVRSLISSSVYQSAFGRAAQQVGQHPSVMQVQNLTRYKISNGQVEKTVLVDLNNHGWPLEGNFDGIREMVAGGEGELYVLVGRRAPAVLRRTGFQISSIGKQVGVPQERGKKLRPIIMKWTEAGGWSKVAAPPGIILQIAKCSNGNFYALSGIKRGGQLTATVFRRGRDETGWTNLNVAIPLDIIPRVTGLAVVNRNNIWIQISAPGMDAYYNWSGQQLISKGRTLGPSASGPGSIANVGGKIVVKTKAGKLYITRETPAGALRRLIKREAVTIGQ